MSFGADCLGELGEHRAGVELRDELEDGGAGLASPAISARCTGAAPRHRGSSEKCRLIQPCRGSDSSGSRMSPPYATITPRSGRSAADVLGEAPSRFALSIGKPELGGDAGHRRWA